MIVGVHTPETKFERDVTQLRNKTAEAELHFPIAVDNDKKTWSAWGNNWWPTVYVIDRQGYMCYFWQGELNWQAAGGHKVVARHVNRLLETPR